MPNTSRSTDPSVYDYRMFNEKFINTADVLEPPTAENAAFGQPSHTDLQALRLKEKKAVQRETECVIGDGG